MNLLQSVALTLLVLLALVAGAWLVHEHGKRTGSTTDVAAAAFHQAQAERLLAQRDAALAGSAERDSLIVAEQLRADSLAAEDARKARTIAALRVDLRTAEARADELADRFAQTGDVADCSDALGACTEARQRASEVIDGLSESLTTKAELVMVQRRQIEHLGVRGDSALAALHYTNLAYDEQEARAEVFQRAASRYKFERNAVAIGAGVVIVGILVSGAAK